MIKKYELEGRTIIYEVDKINNMLTRARFLLDADPEKVGEIITKSLKDLKIGKGKDEPFFRRLENYFYVATLVDVEILNTEKYFVDLYTDDLENPQTIVEVGRNLIMYSCYEGKYKELIEAKNMEVKSNAESYRLCSV